MDRSYRLARRSGLAAAILVSSLLVAPAGAQVGEALSFGTHAVRHPGSRAIGLATVEIERDIAVFTSRLLGEDGALLGTLRFPPSEDGSVQVELSREGHRWAGEGDGQALTVTDLETGDETVLRWRPRVRGQDPGGWESDQEPPEAALLLAHGYAESVAALGLAPWE